MMLRTLSSLLVASTVASIASSDLIAQGTRYRDLIFPAADRQNNVAYGSAVNRYSKQTETLRLDVYTPRGDQAQSRAAMVVVHGGGFRGGDKGTTNFIRLCTDFARRGYVAVSINYRLRPRTQPFIRENATDAGHDMKAAVRWLRRNRAQLRVDPTRIGCIGSSAGGMTVCEAGYVEGEGSSGNPGFSSEVHAVIELWGGLLDLDAMERGEAPVQIIHGTNDSTVPYKNATDLDARARQVGVTSELFPIQGAGHGPWTQYFTSYHQAHAIPFLYEHLRLGMLSALRARSGWASPGTLTLDNFGIASDFAVLYVAAGSADIPVAPYGTLCLDPASMVYIGAARFGASPRLPARALRLTVPAGIRGTLHWQTLQLDGPQLRLLSNCVSTRF